MALVRFAFGLTVLVGLFAFGGKAQAAAIVFFEDFESYPPETELMDDVPEWFRRSGSNPTGVLYVREGQGLSSQVADGYTYPGFGTQVEAMHALDVPVNAATITLSTDAYAFSFDSASGVRSHNFTLYLSNDDASIVYGWAWLTAGDSSCSGGWHFNGNGLGPPAPRKCFNAANAVDQAVALEVLVDLENATVQGRIQHSGPGIFETDIFSVPSGMLAELDHLYSYIAYQGDHDYNGGELDNILVTSVLQDVTVVSAPVSSGLLAAGFWVLLMLRRRTFQGVSSRISTASSSAQSARIARRSFSAKATQPSVGG